MRVGAVLRPSMLFALLDRAVFQQHGDCPAAERTRSRPSFFHDLHRNRSTSRTNPCPPQSFRPPTQDGDSELHGSATSCFAMSKSRLSISCPIGIPPILNLANPTPPQLF